MIKERKQSLLAKASWHQIHSFIVQSMCYQFQPAPQSLPSPWLVTAVMTKIHHTTPVTTNVPQPGPHERRLCGYTSGRSRLHTHATQESGSALSPPSFIPSHLDVGAVVIFGYWGNASHGRLLSELKLFADGRSARLAFLQNTLGIRGLAVGEGGRLEGGESTLVQTGVTSRWAHW